MSNKQYGIKNCGCGGKRVWQVWEVENQRANRGQSGTRYIKRLTGKLTKEEAEKKLREYENQVSE